MPRRRRRSFTTPVLGPSRPRSPHRPEEPFMFPSLPLAKAVNLDILLFWSRWISRESLHLPPLGRPPRGLPGTLPGGAARVLCRPLRGVGGTGRRLAGPSTRAERCGQLHLCWGHSRPRLAVEAKAKVGDWLPLGPAPALALPSPSFSLPSLEAEHRRGGTPAARSACISCSEHSAVNAHQIVSGPGERLRFDGTRPWSFRLAASLRETSASRGVPTAGSGFIRDSGGLP